MKDDVYSYQTASIRESMSIQLNGINCFYGAHQALFDITLDCPQGETLVLLGPSGAGKSSLLRVLNLLEMPRSGTLTIAGNHFDFTKTPSDKAIRELRQNVGMVFQQYNLWPHLTVQQNLIEAPCRVLGLSKDQALARAEKLLERLRLKPYSDRYPLHLSGGQQQRVAIARALMMEPQVLLLTSQPPRWARKSPRKSSVLFVNWRKPKLPGDRHSRSRSGA